LRQKKETGKYFFIWKSFSSSLSFSSLIIQISIDEDEDENDLWKK